MGMVWGWGCCKVGHCGGGHTLGWGRCGVGTQRDRGDGDTVGMGTLWDGDNLGMGTLWGWDVMGMTYKGIPGTL